MLGEFVAGGERKDQHLNIGNYTLQPSQSAGSSSLVQGWTGELSYLINYPILMEWEYE